MLTFPKPDIEQFFQTLSVQDFVLSPNEKQLVVSSNINGHYNLWGMDLPNMFPYPLTAKNQKTHALHYAKNGDFLIVGFDQDGDENIQLYALEPSGGSLLDLRQKEGEKHYFGALTDDGERLFYTSSKDNPSYLNGYCFDLTTGEETVVVEGNEAIIELIDVSADEKSILYSKHFSNSFMPAIVKTNGKDLSLTPPTDDEFTVTEAIFTTNDSIYFTTNYEADFSYLARFDIHTNEFTKVLELEGEELSSIKYDKTNGRLFITSTSKAEDRLFVYDLQNNQSKQISLPIHFIKKLIVSTKGSLYLLGEGSTQLNNIYRLDIIERNWEQLTNYKIPGVSKEELVEPEVVTYTSFDGLKIEALFYRANEERNNGHVIHWPHGGPQSSERKYFISLYQLLLNRGYSIFAPNFRGSTGYGLKFMKMVEQDWGFGPRLDNVKGIEWLVENGYVDYDKVFLMGGSFGGYMSLLLHGRHPEYFKAVVDICGPSNLFSFIDSVPEHWKPGMHKFVGDPVEQKDKLIEDSPSTYLDHMKKPMLMIQGANDPRVVKAESDQLVEALEKNGTVVDYMVLEDEGHGFSKKENEIKVYRRILEFFEQYR
ncbi:S9 family peptidase [Alkalihalobacillus sp. AL-G]|nr:S9 family peptidase [Alkalihalobacillus sp. AL-G]WLD91607.1 S9 family peptidase [Alkalihalobacillus sp. AL-G]